jgi:RNA polymerase sigma-70 factor (ECF subfamily)
MATPAQRPAKIVGAEPAEPADAELARRVSRGDREAAALLVNRYQAMVRRFLLKLTGRPELADDLAQDTFMRMLRYAGRYDAKYPMRTWLLTIARRLSINRGRHDGRMIATEEWGHVPATGERPDERAARADGHQQLRSKLDAALEQLSEPQRQAIVLFHQQGLGVHEAAEVMGLPVGTVKSHLHRGRAAMRKILGDMPEVSEP